MTAFYLGTHMPHWLERTTVPLFVSPTRLVGRRSFPRARGRWALDSGGFTQLHRGGWDITPHQYVGEIHRFADEIGGMDWAAPMDWMCEPSARKATGKTTTEHQRLTVDNLLDLRSLAPDLPIIPVLQGWDLPDYLRHVDMYDQAGIDLTREPRIGLGTVCRRQATNEVFDIIWTLQSLGLRLHGFGVKTRGLAKYGPHLTSADSLAWSYDGRRTFPCTHGAAMNEANCLPFALDWRTRVVDLIDRTPATLFDPTTAVSVPQ